MEQANELAAHLLKLDPPIEQVYSSPYYRCMQTIQPFVRDLRSQPSGNVSVDTPPKVRADLGLSEWFGLAHFEHPSPASLNELQNHFPEIDASYASTLAPSRRGESLPQLHDRVAKAIDTIIRRSDEEGHKAVIICTHAAVVIALGRVLTGRVEEDYGAFTCGLSKYKRQGVRTSITSSDDKTGTHATALAARGEKQIPEARSEAHSEIGTAAGGVDPCSHGSRRPGQGSSRRGNTGLYGGWICELDSDCSFLSCGEERGW